MTYSVLPIFPLIVFGVLEPIALVWAWIVNLQDPAKFYQDQHPNGLPTVLTPQALSLTLQMGNVLLLLAFLAIVCCWTHHPDVANKYTLALAIGDLGHIYASYRGLGDDYFFNPSTWNDMAWGNIGASVFLNVVRWLTLLGVFGTVGGRKAVAKKNK